MGKYNIVPWFLSISVPVAMAWVAGFAISSADQSDAPARLRAKTSPPQLAAPFFDISKLTSEEKTESVKQEELSAPGEARSSREVSEAGMVEPLQTLTMKFDDGLTRTVKIYEEPLDE